MPEDASEEPLKPSAFRVSERSELEVNLDGETIKPSYTFYRGENTSFLPMAIGMESATALAEHVLKGWMPREPFIDQDTNIISFGSCFAENIARYLDNLGYNVVTKKNNKAYVSSMGDGIVNTFALRQQFEWAWEGKMPSVPLWHDYRANEFGYHEGVRLATKEIFDSADVFIVTLGLSEIWYDEPTGEVFWRAVPYTKFDASRHKFRVATSAENFANLVAIRELIRTYRPNAKLVITLSPIPLTATFRSASPITANMASKSNLRSAIDEFFLENAHDKNIYYFPSYEVVLCCFKNIFTYDFRHPHLHILTLNMKAFERYFCKTGMTDEDLGKFYLDAVSMDRAISADPDVVSRDKVQSETLAWLQSHPVDNVARASRHRMQAKHEKNGRG